MTSLSQTMTVQLATLDHTARLGATLGRIAESGDIITLEGGLGAGKTTLTQAIGQGLQVPSTCYITSPTFSLLHEYPGRIPLYHMDLYRLAGAEDLEMVGFEEYLYGNGLTVIEWPDRLEELMPLERLQVILSFADQSGRIAVIIAHGDAWQKKMAHLASNGLHCSPKPPQCTT